MTGELSGIQVGLSFGSYSDKVNNYKNEYTVKFDQNAKQDGNKSKFTLFKKGTLIPVGNGYKELIRYSEYSQPQYVNSIIFKGNLQYGGYGKSDKQLDKFDYIVNEKKNQFAIDLNGNNKVDENEIFSGQFDIDAYRSSKKDGDLNKYKYYQEINSLK